MVRSNRLRIPHHPVYLKLLRYTKNVGWLLVPVLLWNVALASRLPHGFSPAVFWFNIPPLLSAAENTLRMAVFALPFLAPLECGTKTQKVGLAVFGVGLVIYGASWIPLILVPHSAWSQSAAGFLAPSYTPVVWLLGLALLMQRLFWRVPYRWWIYLVLSAAFLAVHISHAALVFTRLPHASGVALSSAVALPPHACRRPHPAAARFRGTMPLS